MNNIKQNLDYRINIPTNYEHYEILENHNNSDIFYNDIPKEVCIDLPYENEPIKENTVTSIINKIKKWIK
jgi:hypothetical protein